MPTAQSDIHFVLTQLSKAITDEGLTDSERIDIIRSNTLVEHLGVLLDHPMGIYSDPGTGIACSKCGSQTADIYYLRCSHGRYDLLCYQQGRGCHENTPIPNCSFKGEFAIPCELRAEFLVSDSCTSLEIGYACRDHVGKLTADGAAFIVAPVR